MKKVIISALVVILGLCFFGLKRSIDSNPDLLFVGAQQDSTKGALVRFILRDIVTVDWNKPTEYGETYMNMLVANCNPWTQICGKVAEVMIRQGANINATSVNNLGFAPLHAALGNTDAVRFLLENGSNPNQAAAGEKFKGLTPIQVAEKFKQPPAEVIQLLSSKGGH